MEVKPLTKNQINYRKSIIYNREQNKKENKRRGDMVKEYTKLQKMLTSGDI